MRRPNAFTILELTAALLVIGLAVALLLLPPSPRIFARQMQNSTQLRGIHQGLIMYAQGNGFHYPGLHPDGSDAGLTVANRYQILLDGNYFTGEYAISPVEIKTVWTTGAVTPANYSFAMLQIPAAGGRRVEWSETLNTDAPVMSNRNIGTAAVPMSVFSDSAPNQPYASSSHTYSGAGWQGSVVYNDNHVNFEQTHRLPTRYGVASSPAAAAASTPGAGVPGAGPLDDLFTAAGADDALMIHRGN